MRSYNGKDFLASHLIHVPSIRMAEILGAWIDDDSRRVFTFIISKYTGANPTSDYLSLFIKFIVKQCVIYLQI